MITEFAGEKAQITITAIVFIVSFASFLGAIAWTYAVSRSYLKKAEELPNNDKSK